MYRLRVKTKTVQNWALNWPIICRENAYIKIYIDGLIEDNYFFP